LRETELTLLIARLLRHGARTFTVNMLTGVNDSAIRDIYREIFDRSPRRGPCGHSYSVYTSRPITQFDSSIAASILRFYLVAAEMRAAAEIKAAAEASAAAAELAGSHSKGTSSAEDLAIPIRRYWLAHAYCEAYDYYHPRAKAFPPFGGGLTFERFAFLGHMLERRSVLDIRSCERCSFCFVSGVDAQFARANRCPSCAIKSMRECARCGVYVPLAHGDVPPRRPPVCISCALITGRITTITSFFQSVLAMPSLLADAAVREMFLRVKAEYPSLCTPASGSTQVDEGPEPEDDGLCHFEDPELEMELTSG
jgi:hypothetical protein